MRNIRVWRRLGMVLSALWFVGFGSWMWSDQATRIGDSYGRQLESCYTMERIRVDLITPAFDASYFDKMDKSSKETEACFERAQKVFYSEHDRLRSEDWKTFLLLDIASVTVAWLLLCVIFLIGRWVIAPASQRIER
jgi:hypothetical protein